jgi:hypothetical protein
LESYETFASVDQRGRLGLTSPMATF